MSNPEEWENYYRHMSSRTTNNIIINRSSNVYTSNSQNPTVDIRNINTPMLRLDNNIDLTANLAGNSSATRNANLANPIDVYGGAVGQNNIEEGNPNYLYAPHHVPYYDEDDSNFEMMADDAMEQPEPQNVNIVTCNASSVIINTAAYGASGSGLNNTFNENNSVPPVDTQRRGVPNSGIRATILLGPTISSFLQTALQGQIPIYQNIQPNITTSQHTNDNLRNASSAGRLHRTANTNNLNNSNRTTRAASASRENILDVIVLSDSEEDNRTANIQPLPNANPPSNRSEEESHENIASNEPMQEYNVSPSYEEFDGNDSDVVVVSDSDDEDNVAVDVDEMPNVGSVAQALDMQNIQNENGMVDDEELNASLDGFISNYVTVSVEGTHEPLLDTNIHIQHTLNNPMDNIGNDCRDKSVACYRIRSRSKLDIKKICVHFNKNANNIMDVDGNEVDDDEERSVKCNINFVVSPKFNNRDDDNDDFNGPGHNAFACHFTLNIENNVFELFEKCMLMFKNKDKDALHEEEKKLEEAKGAEGVNKMKQIIKKPGLDYQLDAQHIQSNLLNVCEASKSLLLTTTTTTTTRLRSLTYTTCTTATYSFSTATLDSNLQIVFSQYLGDSKHQPADYNEEACGDSRADEPPISASNVSDADKGDEDKQDDKDKDDDKDPSDQPDEPNSQ